MTLNDSDWWLFWTTLAGAIVGAVVSGAVSYIQARSASAETLARDDQERRDRDKATAFRVHVKLSCIVSNLGGFYRQIEGAIAASEKAGITGSLWTKLDGFAGAYPHLHFDADELAILVAMKKSELLMTLMTVTDRHNNFMDAIRTYSTRRLAFEDKYGAPTNVTPAMPILSPMQSAKAGPLMAELDGLAEQIRAFVKEDFETAWTLARGIDQEFRTAFQDPSFPQTELRDDTAAFLKGRTPPMTGHP